MWAVVEVLSGEGVEDKVVEDEAETTSLVELKEVKPEDLEDEVTEDVVGVSKEEESLTLNV